MKLPLYLPILIALVDCNCFASTTWQISGLPWTPISPGSLQRKTADVTAWISPCSIVGSSRYKCIDWDAHACLPFRIAAAPRSCPAATHLVAKLSDNRRRRGKSRTSSSSPPAHVPSSHGSFRHASNVSNVLDYSGAETASHTKSLKEKSSKLSVRDQSIQDRSALRKQEAAGVNDPHPMTADTSMRAEEAQAESGPASDRRREGQAAGDGDHPHSKQKRGRIGSLYSVALQQVGRKNYQAARRMFSMLSENPEYKHDGRIFLTWGRMEAKLKNTWAARRAFGTGLKRMPENTHIAHAWAIEEVKNGNNKVARKLFKHALQMDKRDGLIYQSFALLEQQEGNINAARQLLKEGREADPSNVFLWSACGVFESRQGNYEEASRYFEKATSLGPMHCQSWQAFGVVLEKMGKYKEAAEKFEQGLQVDPGSVPTYQAYGLMEARRGRHGKARELFEKGVRIDPRHAPIFHAWACMEESLGNYDTARDLFNQGVASAPSSVALLKAWALMELKLGHIDSSNNWYVDPRMGKRKLTEVTERLEMLRLLMEQRSEDDLKLVMQWLEEQRNKKIEKQVEEMLTPGKGIPSDWMEGRQFTFEGGDAIHAGETVVVDLGRERKKLKMGLVLETVEDVGLQGGGESPGGFLVISMGEGSKGSKKPVKIGWPGKKEENVVEVSRRQVGKLLLDREQMVERVREMEREEGDVDSFSLHEQREADKVRLQVLMERYGEDFNILPFHLRVQDEESWEEEEEEEEVGREEEDVLVESKGKEQNSSMMMLEQWVHRRSDDDVRSFKEWFNEMYERDPGAGMKMLDWEMPLSPSSWRSPVVPKEWFKVELPPPRRDNDDVDSAEGLVQKMAAEKGVRTEWVKVLEFSVLALVLSSFLAVGPSFIDAWVQRVDPSSVRQPQGPSGVDAFLIQTDFSKDRLVLPNGLDDCDHVLPRFITRCSPREGEVKPELRQKILSAMAQGKPDAEILSMEEVKGSGVSSTQLQAIRQEFVQVKARTEALGGAGGRR